MFSLCNQYGDNAMALDLMLCCPNLHFVHIGPKKSSAGYNLTDLFIGSEGTLGIITSAIMKLHPLPEAVSAAIVHFPSTESAVHTVVQTMQSSLPIARIELLDEVSVRVTARFD